MSKASLIAMLVVGLAMVPTGLFMNYSLNGTIDDATPEVLLAIQEGAEETIEDNLWIVANADALDEIVHVKAQDKLPALINGATTATIINSTLEGLYDFVLSSKLINSTIAAKLINGTIHNVASALAPFVGGYANGEVMARDRLFNNYTFQDTHPGTPIQGVSEFGTGDTYSYNFSATAIANILDGVNFMGTDFPGLTTDLNLGTGLAEWMGLFAWTQPNATNDLTEQQAWQNTMAAAYGLPYLNITWVATWIMGHLWSYSIIDPWFTAEYTAFPNYAYAYEVIVVTTMVRELYFNDPNFNTTTFGKVGFWGVSEYNKYVNSPPTGNLSFTTLGQNYTLLGHTFIFMPGILDLEVPLPGLITDTGLGTGVIGFQLLMENATNNKDDIVGGNTIDDATLRSILTTGYNTTWYNLANLSSYISNYLQGGGFGGVVQNALNLNYAATTKYMTTMEDAVNVFVYIQWTTQGIFGGALDLKLLEPPLPRSVFGLESLVQVPYTSYEKLFDIVPTDDGLGLCDQEGQLVWNSAYDGDSGDIDELAEAFGITETQVEALADWLYEGDDCFQELALPTLFEYDQGVTIKKKAKLLFLEQWAEGTLEGDVVYPDGLPLGETPAGVEVTGIELGTESNIYNDDDTQHGTAADEGGTATDLWDEDNEMSFTNTEDGGYDKWILADNDAAAFKELKEEFDLSNTQTRIIINWLVEFKSEVLGPLAESQGQPNPILLRDILTYGLIIPGAIIALIGLIKLKKL